MKNIIKKFKRLFKNEKNDFKKEINEIHNKYYFGKKEDFKFDEDEKEIENRFKKEFKYLCYEYRRII